MSQEVTVTVKGKKYARDTIEKWQPEFEKVLQGMEGGYFTNVALIAIQNSPKLLECTELSWFTALRQAAALSLPVDGSLGHAYLVPYAKKATLIIGYKGLRELAFRTGLFFDIQAECVYKNDKFVMEKGLNPRLEHIPTSGVRGEVIGCYVIAFRLDGNKLFNFMWMDEILRIRDNYSQAYKNAEKVWGKKPASKDSMWHTDPEMAYKKTVLRSMCGNRVQLSVVAQKVMNKENLMDAGLDVKDDDVIDIGVEIPGSDTSEPGDETGGEKQKGVGGMVDAIRKGNGSDKPVDQDDSGAVDLRTVIREKIKEIYPKVAWAQKFDDVCTHVLGESEKVYDIENVGKAQLTNVWEELNR